MSGWLIKLAAIILATSCAEILLPTGKIKNSCRTVLALVCVAVFIEPLAHAVNFEMDLSDIFGDDVAVDQTYVDDVNDYYCSILEGEIANLLSEKGAEVSECSVSGEIINGKFEIKNVIVKIDNSVISGADEHIISIVEITSMLSEALGITSERVIVYGE